MSDQELPSLEELIRRYNVVDAPIDAVDLETGMVWRSGEKLRIVISVGFKNTEAGPIVIVETVAGLERFPGNARFDVWHIDGKPFLIDLPPEDMGPSVPGAVEGGSAPPAHDAVGIVPVGRGPKRPN